MINDFYREEILEHWRNPQNWGIMDSADLVVDQINPLCGDRLTFYFRLNQKSKVKSQNGGSSRPFENSQDGQARTIIDVSFTGSACAISIASASILSENIKNRSLGDVSKIKGEDVLAMIGGSVAPARLKCAFLGLEAVRKLKI